MLFRSMDVIKFYVDIYFCITQLLISLNFAINSVLSSSSLLYPMYYSDLQPIEHNSIGESEYFVMSNKHVSCVIKAELSLG